ncbi:hypothetical protein [uncultured Pontibacter sp.]|uniref:DUF6970 domain-containing protein n=1 Tax=uncultured Pontibacter sp. TaxID=453356 RepID=UPI00263976C0|nr:hypothetical protein [uncultured Pontibacter sp.]
MAAYIPSGLVLALLILATGCQTSEKSAPNTEQKDKDMAQTAWLSELVRELEQEPVANPPARVYRYLYNEQEVYYLTGRCCDIPGKLYDVEGNLLCEPDGGITGKGDGRCPDFVDVRTNETLIWEDKRES